MTGFDLGRPAFAPSVDEATARAMSVGLDATLLVVDERSNVVSALPVQFRRRVTLGDTATLFGTDESEAIRVVATVTTRPAGLKLNLRYFAGSPALPRQLLGSLRFLRALRRPNRLGLMVGERSIGEPEELPADEEFPQHLVELVRSLAFVQTMSGTEFSMPAKLDDADLRTLREAEALLRGETVSSRWADARLGLSSIDAALLDVVQGGAPFRLEFTAPVLAHISGYEVVLGEAHYVFRVAVIENYDELVDAAETGDVSDAPARLRPGDDDGYEVTLVAPPDVGFDHQDLRPPVVALGTVLDAARSQPLRRQAFHSEAS